MRVYRDEPSIRSKERMGRRLSLAGLGVLFVGMLASFTPNVWPPDATVVNPVAEWLQFNWAYISFAALPLGFICASVGSYFINRFARRRWPGGRTIARPDELLERNMRGFDDKYTYFAWALPANYVVAGPFGLLLFAVRSDKSKVTVNGDRFREPFGIGRIFTVFAREGLGNPVAELNDHERKMRELLAKEKEGEGGEVASVPIYKAVVFLNPEAEVNADGPVLPVLRGEQVKEHLRRLTREDRIEAGTARALTEFLIENNSGVEQQQKPVKK